MKIRFCLNPAISKQTAATYERKQWESGNTSRLTLSTLIVDRKKSMKREKNGCSKRLTHNSLHFFFSNVCHRHPGYQTGEKRSLSPKVGNKKKLVKKQIFKGQFPSSFPDPLFSFYKPLPFQSLERGQKWIKSSRILWRLLAFHNGTEDHSLVRGFSHNDSLSLIAKLPFCYESFWKVSPATFPNLLQSSGFLGLVEVLPVEN